MSSYLGGRGIRRAKGKVYWIEYYDLQRRRRRERIGPNRQVAEARLAEVKRQLAAGKFIPEAVKGAIKFEDFWQRYYLLYCKQENSPGWYQRKLAIYRHLARFFGGKKLKEITTEAVERFKQERLSEGATPAEVNREVAVLKHMLNYAVKLDLLLHNPASKVSRLKERQEDAWHVLSVEEAERLLKCLPESSRPVFAFALATGLRISNILNLRWDQVNLKERKLIIPPSKTKGRKPLALPLSDAAVKILQGVQGMDTTFVFVNPATGMPYSQRGIRSTLKRALKRAGLPESVRVHDLRHTFASWAIRSGVDLRILKELLGHSTLQMVLRYTHLDHLALLEQVNRIPFPKME